MNANEEDTMIKQRFLTEAIKKNGLSRANFLEYIAEKKDDGLLISP